ncbi:hypothetical protein ACS15_0160 [Ralstonia insidiosa]|uniref:Uncharacterized protein n=1 Tax=Ralstonia insidiosa TaxID=190721 RepID=A0AAC9BH72_9RALS|nr:hypothetical protein ACS15_0160 [Ralstonia insidiosa]
MAVRHGVLHLVGTRQQETRRLSNIPQGCLRIRLRGRPSRCHACC